MSENNATAVCLCTFTSAKVTSRSDLTRSTHFSPWWCTSRDHFLYSISKGEKKKKRWPLLIHMCVLGHQNNENYTEYKTHLTLSHIHGPYWCKILYLFLNFWSHSQGFSHWTNLVLVPHWVSSTPSWELEMKKYEYTSYGFFFFGFMVIDDFAGVRLKKKFSAPLMWHLRS